jgi:DNA topoisomerase I
VDDEAIRQAFEDQPELFAKDAGLRYVTDDEPGYGRRRSGRGFSYRDWTGNTVRGRALRRRFASLAIPPAWTEVWICRDDQGHIQATGRDAAGRKQYLYHEGWREVRDRGKYDRMLAFGRLLPRIRRRVRRDLARVGLPREKVLAAIVHLLETSRARIGNDAYARENDSHGLTTIRKKHVAVDEDTGDLVVEFAGKGGKPWRVEVEDPRVEQIILECLEIPGYEVFKYFDDDGDKRDVSSDDVNAYLEEITGARVRSKDFRTWAGTVLAAVALGEVERAIPGAERDERLLRAVEQVAAELGNTPAVCRGCYIHPEILDAFDTEAVERAALKRARARLKKELAGLRAEEVMVLAFLEHRLAERAAAAA